MNRKYLSDRVKNTGGGSRVGYVLRFLFCLRHASQARGPVRLLLRLCLKHYREHYGLEISPATEIGYGLYLGHAYNITVNPEARLGDNVSLHKGCVIGGENRGARKGSPHLGSCVWVGINAIVVGRITVGDDVLIAPGAYVNRDIPSHSIVLGNPCRVIPRQDATLSYINHRVGPDGRPLADPRPHT